MPRSLPNAESLNQAVQLVISSNRADGYVPAYFMKATGNGQAPDLVSVCERLLLSQHAFASMMTAVQQRPTLLFLEDFVIRSGHLWNLSDASIAEAKARCQALDLLAGGQRYV